MGGGVVGPDVEELARWRITRGLLSDPQPAGKASECNAARSSRATHRSRCPANKREASGQVFSELGEARKGEGRGPFPPFR